MKTGLELLLADPHRFLAGKRFGFVGNPTSVDHHLRHAVDALAAQRGLDLARLFGPEHGIRGDAQDMIEVGNAKDSVTGLPVVSLYGTTAASLAPTVEQLADLDLLVFDIQDIGTRYYTYAATMALCMQVARRAKVKVLVLDRPNPLGGVAVEGSGIDAGLESFVGLYPVPQRHGMTTGELAQLYNTAFGIGCELEVLRCEGWKRGQLFDETGLPWVMPSPNMPTLDTALVYPGMCLLEGTNLSEGRGTTRPFELFGAPFIEPEPLARALETLALPGVVFRPCTIRPTFHKWAGEACGGLQLHVTDRATFASYRTGLAVLAVVKRLYPNHFAWRTKTYEFRDDVPAIDLLTGRAGVREAIDAEVPFDEIMRIASFGREAYDAGRAAALLYE